MKLKGSDFYQNKGFPRVPVSDLFGVVSSFIKCTITSEYFYSEESIWEDDIYPHRFNFEIVEKQYDLNFGVEFFNQNFVSAIRDSLLTKGSIVGCNNLANDSIFDYESTDDYEVTEGRPIYKTHIYRERDKKIIDKKKNQVLKENKKLECEACFFNFEAVYGDRGDGYIECHHKNPLADLLEEQVTKLDDLALLCANCHRIIHRYKPWISVDKLKGIMNG